MNIYFLHNHCDFLQMKNNFNNLNNRLSIIIQGPVFLNCNEFETTYTVLKSLRKYFEGAEIILSTWRDQDVSGLDYDKLILNDDPGATYTYPGSNTFHNLNRQIVSTFNGIRESSREFVLKTRTDLVYTRNNFWNYYHKFYKQNSLFKISDNKIIVANITSVNPNKDLKLPFHPCDWIYFGKNQDLFDLFNVPLSKDDLEINYFVHNAFPSNHPNHLHTHRFTSESYLWLNYCKRKFHFTMNHLCDINQETIDLSEKLFGSNLIILNQEQIAFYSFKNRFNFGENYINLKNNMYTYSEYVKLYNQCNAEQINYFDYYYFKHLFYYYFKKITKKIKMSL